MDDVLFYEKDGSVVILMINCFDICNFLGMLGDVENFVEVVMFIN